ncbi:MAG TPA: glycogen/starch synthase, partial [Saprospiraceae bacterium]
MKEKAQPSPHILMVSAECYPAAKVGGLADVVGSLPRYLNKSGQAQVAVIIPGYHNAWLTQQEYREAHAGAFHMGGAYIEYRIAHILNEELGYDLYVVDIPGKFDRPGVYGDHDHPFYRDEVERNIAFQRAVLQWVHHWEELPGVIHCHDHHTALMPFMMTQCPEFWRLGATPTVLTIHNAAYQGMFGWDRQHLLPDFSRDRSGLLDWGSVINSLACGIKCAWRITTVSQNYLRELMETYGFGLQGLLRSEWHKCRGVVNGIDYDYWNPATDPYLKIKLKKSVDKWKKDNKHSLLTELNMPTDLPLHIFIGRMVHDKGIDFL